LGSPDVSGFAQHLFHFLGGTIPLRLDYADPREVLEMEACEWRATPTLHWKEAALAGPCATG
jgi:hypothetical protein